MEYVSVSVTWAENAEFWVNYRLITKQLTYHYCNIFPIKIITFSCTYHNLLILDI